MQKYTYRIFNFEDHVITFIVILTCWLSKNVTISAHVQITGKGIGTGY